MNGEYYTNDYNVLTGNNKTNTMYQDNDMYIENILKSNKGKKVTLHVTVPGSSEWQDKTFEGIIEDTNKDHIILSNPENGEWYLVPIIYIAFITFFERVNNNNNRFYS